VRVQGAPAEAEGVEANLGVVIIQAVPTPQIYSSLVLMIRKRKGKEKKDLKLVNE
jgi:hypothetical protein